MDKQHRDILSQSHDISSIGKPFFDNMDISYFVYTKSIKDGGVIALSSNATIVEQSLQAEYTPPAETWNGLSVPKGIYIASPEITTGTWITEGLPAQREVFNIDHPITLINTLPNFVETFTFMTNRNNYHFINKALNQLDLFWKFTDYFLDKTQPLANKLLKKPLRFEPVITTSDIVLISGDEKAKLIDKIKPGKYYFQHNNETIKLSRRQCECLQQLALGKTIKEIATSLLIKPNTVESYLGEIKTKLQCNTRAELVQIFLANMYYS